MEHKLLPLMWCLLTIMYFLQQLPQKTTALLLLYRLHSNRIRKDFSLDWKIIIWVLVSLEQYQCLKNWFLPSLSHPLLLKNIPFHRNLFFINILVKSSQMNLWTSMLHTMASVCLEVIVWYIFHNEDNVASGNIKIGILESVLYLTDFSLSCPIHLSSSLIFLFVFFLFFFLWGKHGLCSNNEKVKCSLWECCSNWQDYFTCWLYGKLFMVSFLNICYLLPAGNTVNFTSPEVFRSREMKLK